MADEYTFTQGNTRPYFAVQIVDEDDVAVSLSGATVTFYFADQLTKEGTAAKVNGSSVTVTSAADGECEYRWASGDLDVPGIYDATFRITYSDATVEDVVIENVVVRAKLGS